MSANWSMQRTPSIAWIEPWQSTIFSVYTGLVQRSSWIVTGHQHNYTVLVIGNGDRSSSSSSSSEGTTQGDPLSMAVYVLTTVPLIDRLTKEVPQCRQSWYADDSVVAGEIWGLPTWFNVLSEEGQGYGYNVNLKEPFLKEAHRLFDGHRRTRWSLEGFGTSVVRCACTYC